MDIDTARDGAYRRIGCVIRGSQNALVVRIVCVARIQSLTLGPIEYVFAGEVDTHLADSEFLGELRRQCIAEVDVLQGQVACVDQETVESPYCIRGMFEFGFSGVHALSMSLCQFTPMLPVEVGVLIAAAYPES